MATRRVIRRKRSPRPARQRAQAAPRRLADTEAQRLAHVGCWEWDAASNHVTWTPELYRIYGLTPSQFDGTYESFLSRVHEADRQVTRDTVARSLREGVPFDYDHRIVRPDGEIRVLKTCGGAVPGPDGKTRRLVGCCMDVTDQRRARWELEESLSLLRATLEATADGIFVIDVEGKIVVCNARALELWRLPESLAARGDARELIAKVRDQLADPAEFIRRERELANDLELEALDVLRFKDGRVFERYTRPQRVGHRTVGRVCSFRDVTKQARTCEELERRVAERTAELQRLADELQRSNADLEIFAAAASHDLIAPARKAVSFAELLSRRASGKLDEDSQHLLERLRKSAEDMARLVTDVLALSRAARDPLPEEDVPLDAVMREVAADLEPAVTRAKARLDAGPLPVVRGHRTLWRRLLQNLVANALKFHAVDRQPVVMVRAQALPGGGALISVADNGIGFDPKYAREVFLPFRRLHPSSEYEGTGIGLAACERIARRYGMPLSAESEPGKGSTFTVKVPAPRVVRG